MQRECQAGGRAQAQRQWLCSDFPPAALCWTEGLLRVRHRVPARVPGRVLPESCTWDQRDVPERTERTSSEATASLSPRGSFPEAPLSHEWISAFCLSRQVFVFETCSGFFLDLNITETPDVVGTNTGLGDVKDRRCGRSRYVETNNLTAFVL